MGRRRLASEVAFVGGVLLVLAGSSGSAALYQVLLGFLAEGLPTTLGRVLLTVGVVLGVLAGLGGFTVLLGAWLLAKRSVRLGTFLIDLGAGFGLFGLLLDVGLRLVEREDPVGYLRGFLASLGGAGALLAVGAAAYANPLPMRRWWRRLRRVRA